jgi:hypothetical protein
MNKFAYIIKEHKYIENEYITLIEIDPVTFGRPEIREENSTLVISLLKPQLLTSVDSLKKLHEDKTPFYLRHKKVKAYNQKFYLFDYHHNANLTKFDLYFKEHVNQDEKEKQECNYTININIQKDDKMDANELIKQITREVNKMGIKE